MHILQKGVSWGMACALLLGASFAHAAVLRSGDVVSVPQDATIAGDFYATGNQIQLSGPVEGDVYVAGGTVTLNGPVSGDVVVVGGTVTINGEVKDDVRVLSGKVIIADRVGGDVVALAGSLSLLSSSKVDGDVFFYLGEAGIEGEVLGTVHARAESVAVSGLVHALDVTLSDTLEVRDGAVVKGDVAYESPDQFSRGHTATIEGSVHRKEGEEVREGWSGLPVKGFLMSLFAALLMVLLFRTRLTHLLETTKTHIPLAGLLGLAGLLTTPLLVGLLLVTIIGVLPGVALLFTYLVFLIVAYALVPVVLGVLIAYAAVRSPQVGILWTALGALALHALLLVPIIGWLIFSVVSIIVLGALLREAYRIVVG